MADYVGLEDASGHVLLEDGTSGLLLEAQLAVQGAASVAETVTVTSTGAITALSLLPRTPGSLTLTPTSAGSLVLVPTSTGTLTLTPR